MNYNEHISYAQKQNTKIDVLTLVLLT